MPRIFVNRKKQNKRCCPLPSPRPWGCHLCAQLDQGEPWRTLSGRDKERHLKAGIICCTVGWLVVFNGESFGGKRVFGAVKQKHQSGQSCQSLQGSKRLLKATSGCGGCLCQAPFAYVYVRAHVRMPWEKTSQKTASSRPQPTGPAPPPPVCALPSRQPYVKSPLLRSNVPRGCRIYLTCPALRRRSRPRRSAREGQR